MTSPEKALCVIIGSGPAGYTAASNLEDESGKVIVKAGAKITEADAKK